MPVGHHVLKALEEALAEAFAYHRDFNQFLLFSGLPQLRLDGARTRAEERKGRWPFASKRVVAQEVIYDLHTGKPEDDRIISAMIDGLCRDSFATLTPNGPAAIERLKSLRKSDSRAAAERRAEQQEAAKEAQFDRDRAASTKADFRAEHQRKFSALTMLVDAQQRGYALEGYLNDFMAFEGLSPRGSYRVAGEQIDGSFNWSERTYLVEAKWVSAPVAGAEFGAFLYKIQGKTVDTRGVFISVNGYQPSAISALNAKGELRFVCLDGSHLVRATAPGMDFMKVLSTVWRHASETGEAYLPVSAPRFIAQLA